MPAASLEYLTFKIENENEENLNMHIFFVKIKHFEMILYLQIRGSKICWCPYLVCVPDKVCMVY